MPQWYLRFSEFPEFTEFNESSAPFKENPIIRGFRKLDELCNTGIRVYMKTKKYQQQQKHQTRMGQVPVESSPEVKCCWWLSTIYVT